MTEYIQQALIEINRLLGAESAGTDTEKMHRDAQTKVAECAIMAAGGIPDECGEAAKYAYLHDHREITRAILGARRKDVGEFEGAGCLMLYAWRDHAPLFTRRIIERLERVKYDVQAAHNTDDVDSTARLLERASTDADGISARLRQYADEARAEAEKYGWGPDKA